MIFETDHEKNALLLRDICKIKYRYWYMEIHIYSLVLFTKHPDWGMGGFDIIIYKWTYDATLSKPSKRDDNKATVGANILLFR